MNYLVAHLVGGALFFAIAILRVAGGDRGWRVALNIITAIVLLAGAGVWSETYATRARIEEVRKCSAMLRGER